MVAPSGIQQRITHECISCYIVHYSRSCRIRNVVYRGVWTSDRIVDAKLRSALKRGPKSGNFPISSYQGKKKRCE
jgi:hypothetical protein